ncbi:MAG TPA: hypothetical protein VEI97_12300 [bacterium]|nr:hypothetical protein [bacterium]
MPTEGSSLARDILRTIDELAQRDYFSQALGGTCTDGDPNSPKSGWSVSRVNEELQGLGVDTDWPVNRDGVVADEHIMAVVEYFRDRLNPEPMFQPAFDRAIINVLEFYGLEPDRETQGAPN